jgi:speckle-type POZ protein
VSRTAPALFRHGGGGSHLAPAQGSRTFVDRSKLEAPASAYVRDDSLRIECVVTVFKFKKASPPSFPAPAPARVEAPTPSLPRGLEHLLETKEGADVTHAIVLATRSPVFKAELYGPMKEQDTGRRHIAIEDMQPDVFRALLHFVYTDTMLPGAMDDGLSSDDGNREFTKHLLVAADRYDVRGLKFVCERRLCRGLTIATVASMFALADRHNCSELQDASLEFITGSDTLADVVESEWYHHLRSLSPDVMIDLLRRQLSPTKLTVHNCYWIVNNILSLFLK